MKQIQRILAGFLMIVICVTLNVRIVDAKETAFEGLQIKISLEGTLPSSPEDYSIKLIADNVTYPMPEGSQEGTFKMNISGESIDTLPAITYTRTGIYTYELLQEPGTTKDVIYDPSVYHMKVFVVNSDDGTGLVATCTLYKDDSPEKCSHAIFSNEYPVLEPDKPKTGDTTQQAGWILLMMASLICIICIENKKRKE